MKNRPNEILLTDPDPSAFRLSSGAFAAGNCPKGPGAGFGKTPPECGAGDAVKLLIFADASAALRARILRNQRGHGDTTVIGAHARA